MARKATGNICVACLRRIRRAPWIWTVVWTDTVRIRYRYCSDWCAQGDAELVRFSAGQHGAAPTLEAPPAPVAVPA